MQIKLLVVGKTRNSCFSEMIEDYLKRTNRFCIVKFIELKDNNNSDPKVQKKEDSELIKTKISPDDYVILLDEKGKKFTSEGFAKKISSLQDKNVKNCVFVVGGAYGFSDSLYERANDQVALSEMTFTHQMVRVIFAEQLYRAFTIINKMPYHH